MSEGTGSGRGLVFITGAKLYFIATGFLVQLGLPRLLGSPEVFGQYSLAMSIVSVINNVLIAATVQSVSKRVSEDPALAGARLAPARAAPLTPRSPLHTLTHNPRTACTRVVHSLTLRCRAVSSLEMVQPGSQMPASSGNRA